MAGRVATFFKRTGMLVGALPLAAFREKVMKYIAKNQAG